MEEKKIPDDELLRLLAIFANDDEPNGVRLLAEGALDLIYRLQDEKQKVVQDYYCEAQHCDVQKDIIEKQKAEIKRLTEENDLKRAQVGLLTEQVEYLKNCGDNFLADCEKLQKQVDELKELNAKYLESIESVQAGRCRLRCILTEQAVKETVEKFAKKVHNLFNRDIKDSVVYTQEEKDILKDFLESIDEICKEITEGKDDKCC